ncbi:MAG: DUF1810 family protein, partial [Synechococcaceae cyanobacterium]|nr:DUF1810 family protein [Synechococcaceae cyanobacterium]
MTDLLQRFHLAQGQGPGSALEQAIAELGAGRKQGHWIWFVLPQLRGLGQSPMSERYGIDNLEEVQAYLADSVLRERLESVIHVIAEQIQKPGQRLSLLMGGDLDATKTISSLTLFSAAGLPSAGRLLDQLGKECQV